MRLAFVDLETTGATPTADRITEVGIVAVTLDAEGRPAEVEEWSSLVNPRMPIPPFITSLTGISEDMVAGAPTFEELAPALHARLDGHVFIAHNARFDHGFLKNAFKTAGLAFKPTVLCTVKLSRRLYPGFSRHNLDSLIERHRLQITERHRALGDARLIWQFWQAAHHDHSVEHIRDVVKQLTARPALPSHLDETLLDALPTRSGVYFFHGESAPLYIGKANNLRQRVMSHFSGDHRHAKELLLSQQVKRVEWIETAGELGALLTEAMLIKQHSPLHNRQLRRNDAQCAWRVVARGLALRVALVQGEDLLAAVDDSLYGTFASNAKATQALRSIVEAHRLCPVLLGLEKGRAGKPCFSSQVGRCAGACRGNEALETHHQRLFDALRPWHLQAWPYAGPIGIREKTAVHVVDQWAYLGTAPDEESAVRLLRQAGGARFDRDVYYILHKRLPQLGERIVQLGKAAAETALSAQRRGRATKPPEDAAVCAASLQDLKPPMLSAQLESAV